MFRLILALCFFIFSLSLAATTTPKEVMRNYCSVPPYMDTSSEPNIILVMDYSGSMQYPAYYEASFSVNVSYNKNQIYYGYFKNGSYYKYDSTNGYWVENTSCENDSDKVGTSKNCISGNFLNFITTSRIDISLNALIGGKFEACGSGYCLITRGMYRKVYDSTSDCTITLGPSDTYNKYYYYYYNSSQYNSSYYDMKINISGENCPITGISNAWIRIYIDNKPKGILQKSKDLGNYALFVFSGDGRYGEIRVGINEYKKAGMNLIVEKIMKEFPNSYTPTGEALWEAYDYLKQSNDHNYESNSAYINRGSEIDPFYDKKLGKLIPCKKNAIILISDGEWNGDVDPLKSGYHLHVDDLRSDLEGNQNAIIFSLFTFANSDAGKNSMKSIAAAGSFIDLDNDNKPFNININSDSRKISYPRPKCNPDGTYNDDKCKEWDKDRDGVPNTYYYADSGERFEKALTDILSAIVKYNYSGGSLGVMGEQSKDKGSIALSYRGSVLAQAMFYSQKDGIDWLGKLYTYWYHFDTNTIREDTNKNKVLELDKDNILIFSIENQKNLKISIYSSNADGTKGTKIKDVNDPSETNYIFEPGEKLKNTQEDPDNNIYSRKIYYAKCKVGEDCLAEFKYTSTDDFAYEIEAQNKRWKIPLLGLPGECFNMCNYWDSFSSFDPFSAWQKFWDCLGDHNDYEKIVNYIRGKDYEGFRTRTINGKVWKLGDIIYSTPKIVEYKDKGESYVFVGANDGMLHVFKAGKLTREGLTKEGEVVKLTGDNLGEEVWSFIPLNVLPYLRFLTDPDYCHLYYVDLTPEIYKTRDNRVILIGGLRLGGATGNTDTEAINPPGWACPANFWDFLKEQCKSCMNIMGFSWMCDFFPSSLPDYTQCIGLSSYFAIDITDPENPKFLWEFSHPDIGFAYSGGTMVFKKNATYVVFGSGPINYKGDSTQELKYFAVSLDGSNVSSPYIIETGINNAFSGRMPKYAYDYNKDDISDYIFVGYSRKDGDMKNWKGGLLKIDVTNENPDYWDTTSYFTDSQPPITAKVEIGRCFNKDYLFFGTGRWFFKLDNPLSGQKNRLYGVPLNCDSTGCEPNTNVADSTSSSNVCEDAGNGVIRSWYIELDLGNNQYLKERNITDPTLTSQNVVLFTTTEPINNLCGFGGRTRVWALNCATGQSIQDTCLSYPIEKERLKGSLLLQLSGGNIEQVNVKEIGDTNKSDNKATRWYIGTAPETSPPLVQGLKKGEILLWLEK